MSAFATLAFDRYGKAAVQSQGTSRFTLDDTLCLLAPVVTGDCISTADIADVHPAMSARCYVAGDDVAIVAAPDTNALRFALWLAFDIEAMSPLRY